MNQIKEMQLVTELSNVMRQKLLRTKCVYGYYTVTSSLAIIIIDVNLI